MPLEFVQRESAPAWRVPAEQSSSLPILMVRHGALSCVACYANVKKALAKTRRQAGGRKEGNGER